MDRGLRQEATALAGELGIPAVRTTRPSWQEALSEARRELAGVWAFLVPLFRANDRSRRVILLAVALVVPLALAAAINALFVHHELVGKLSSLVAGAGTLVIGTTRWVGSQTRWVRGLRARVEPVARAVDAAVDQGIEAALDEQRKAVADKLAELDALRQGQSRAQKERD